MKLNVFQNLMRHWDAIHPYNAAQVLTLRGAPDYALIENTWRDTVDALGLGKAVCNGTKYHFETLNGQLEKVAVSRVPRGSSLERYLTQQLNLRFTEHDLLPFRAFVLEQDGCFQLGIVYHHWVADSASIRLLLREWFFRAFDPSRARKSPLSVARRGYLCHFGPFRARWGLVRSVIQTTRWGRAMKRARRIDEWHYADLNTRFTMHEVPPGMIDGIREFARSRSATVNDLFLAILAEGTDAFVPAFASNKRPDIALGTIVDLRARNSSPADESFGLFLGFTSVLLNRGLLKNFDALLAEVQKQNKANKSQALAGSSMLRLYVALLAARWLEKDELKNWFRRRVPMLAGISNINLNGTWVADYHPDLIRGYLRVSPAGPMLPLVFTPTTLGDTLNFGLTTRSCVLSSEKQTAIANLFVSRLCEIATSGRARQSTSI